ncbi:sugar transferase [Paenibacillus sp. H1-7]|uniref:sugar transferase n=1 Tax=Paenibacillus sp. H1-7 TaxID=2282849 RepID=UPI001EF8542F|nr:sugar transferase [Paenibacillus sp. H1-7]ULL19402.1 sugar transferase [Paenibacillus sp. H1-7]
MYPVVKRTADFLLSTIALLFFWPLLVVIAVLVKLDSKGPIFFKQKRVGKNKKEFYILKFRTMRTDTPKEMPTHMLKDPEAYITKVGKFLRKTSLDELPQIINIIKGEMSIVGPRPALWNQNDLIEERDRYGANDIYPGLTGWAQINGRDELPETVKARYDGEYVRKISLTFDIYVFIKTISAVLRSDGVKEGSQDLELSK